MTRFLARRALSGLITLFLFLSLMFFAIQLILPGDVISHLALQLSKTEMIELRTELGLDLPIWQRYFLWLGNIVRGRFGTSYAQPGGETFPVILLIQAVIPASVLVFGLGTALAFLLGQWLGRMTVWQAWRHRRWGRLMSESASFGSILLYTAFPPWLAFVLLYLFVVKYSVFPRSFDNTLWMIGPYTRFWVMSRMLYMLAAVLVVLLILNGLLYRWRRRWIPVPVFLLVAAAAWMGTWYLAGWWVYALDVIRVAALPMVAYVLLSFGEIMLIMQTSMRDSLHDDYVMAAIGKGLPDPVVRDRHVGRNAILPVLSRLVISLPYLLTGAVMIEFAVGWPGIGTNLFFAVGQQDVNVAMGLLVIIGVISLGARLLLDMLVALFDPRIRYVGRSGMV